MQSKHKIVLALAQELQIKLEEIQKFVNYFKLQSETNYDFINGFSFELENDIKTFIFKEYLKKNERYAFDLDFKSKVAIQDIKNNLEKDKDFINKINEKIRANIIKNNDFKHENKTLFTIGYEGISIDNYIKKLLKNEVKTLIDVRKNAYSNKFGFSKKEFQNCLERRDIKYTHLAGLGIESDKRENLNKERQNSSKKDLPLFGFSSKNLVKSEENKLFTDYKTNLPQKQKYIDELLNILNQDKTIAITCFEKDYKCCHRNVLSEFLKEKFNILIENL